MNVGHDILQLGFSEGADFTGIFPTSDKRCHFNLLYIAIKSRYS